MNHSKNFLRVMLMLVMGAGFVFLQSCATGKAGYTARPVTVSDIVQMSKNGESSAKIIDKIRKSHTVYRLTADQLAGLRDKGVSPQVINYMEATHLAAVRHNQKLEDANYWWPGWDGYYYGGPAFGWPAEYWDYNWGPGVVVDQGVGNEDEEDDEGD